MYRRNRPSSGWMLTVATLLSLILNTAGCAHLRVVRLPNRDVAALKADDVVRVMQEAGFSDKQILAVGTQLRNSLAQRGAAQIRLGDKVEAILVVNPPYLYVSSRQGGIFTYNIETGEMR